MRKRFRVQKLNKDDHKNVAKTAKIIRGAVTVLGTVVAIIGFGIKNNKGK